MKEIRDQYEAETGKKHWTNPVCHGETGFATWDYQLWLEKKLSESQVVKNSLGTATECLPPQGEACGKQEGTDAQFAARVVRQDDSVSQRLRSFAVSYLKWVSDDFDRFSNQEDCEDITELLIANGFIEYVEWQEEEHAHIEGEPGDMIYVMTQDAINVVEAG